VTSLYKSTDCLATQWVRPPLNIVRGVFVTDHSLGLKAVLACP
jgi:hypothetical protein